VSEKGTTEGTNQCGTLTLFLFYTHHHIVFAGVDSLNVKRAGEGGAESVAWIFLRIKVENK
jgi:hypothetical protein